MVKLDKLFELVYSEQDLSRGVATSIGGLAGLLAYYFSEKDGVIAAFWLVIAYSLSRVVISGIHKFWTVEISDELKWEGILEKLSTGEEEIVAGFIESGGCCVPLRYASDQSERFPRIPLNSMIQRGLVRTSVMEDGMTESFVLNSDLFSAALRIKGDQAAEKIAEADRPNK